MTTIIEIVRDLAPNDEENTYLLEIECTPQNLSQIVNLDIRILNELKTEENLCVPLKTIDNISTQFREDIKKGLDDLKVQINLSSTMFTKYHKKKLENLAEEIASEYADAPKEDKDDINKDVKKIIEFHKEKLEIISDSFKVEQLNEMIKKISEQGKLIKTFNLQVIGRVKKKKIESDTLIQNLAQKNQDYTGMINQLMNDFQRQQGLIRQNEVKESRYHAQILQLYKEKNDQQQQVDQQNNLIFYENLKQQELQQQQFIKLNVQSSIQQNLLNAGQEKRNIEAKIEQQYLICQKNHILKSKIQLLKKQNVNSIGLKQNKQKISQLQSQIQSNNQNYVLSTQENNQIQQNIQIIQTNIQQNQMEIHQLQQQNSSYIDTISQYQSALITLKAKVESIISDIQQTNQFIHDCKNEITTNRQIADHLELEIKSKTDINNAENQQISTVIRNIEVEIPKLNKLVIPVKVLDSLSLIIKCLEKFNEAQSNTKNTFLTHHGIIKQIFQELQDNQNALEENNTRRKIKKMAESLKQINESLNDGYENLTTNFKEIDELSNISKQIQYVQSLQQINN